MFFWQLFLAIASGNIARDCVAQGVEQVSDAVDCERMRNFASDGHKPAHEVYDIEQALAVLRAYGLSVDVTRSAMPLREGEEQKTQMR